MAGGNQKLPDSASRGNVGRQIVRAASKFFFLTVFACYAVLLPIIGSIAIVLLGCAETVSGRGFAIGTLSLALAPVAVVFGWRWPIKRWWRFLPAYVLLFTTAMLFGTLLMLAPTGQPSGKTLNGEIGSYWPGPPSYPRYSPFNWVPERDQVKLGTYVLGSTGIAIDVDQIEHVREVAMPLYRKMDQQKEYAQLGSTMHFVWSDVLGGDRGSGHLYYYVPPLKKDERLPLILFAHGAGGNFRAYLYFWQQFCQKHQCAVVCPTFGAGDWRKAGGTETIGRARSFALENLPVDEQQVYLVGLSNGGMGVSRAALAQPDKYRGVVYISGVVEKQIVGSPEFGEAWNDRPILIIHGAHDRRVDRRSADDAHASLSQIGVDVVCHVYPEEDHFLLFGSQDQVFCDLAAWLRAAKPKITGIEK